METLSLNGRWTLSRKGERTTIPAQVPGDVHGALLAAKKIPDPFYRDNEDRLQWIGESEWTYARSFTVPARLLRHERTRLRCAGLDTLAEIRLNGRRLGAADNMFRIWEFEAGALLRPGRNAIQVRFASVMPHIRRLQKQADRPLSPGPRGEIDGRGWVRKQACNFGWDWGVKAVTCGIWRDISLVAFSGARLADVQVHQDHARRPAVDLTVAVKTEAREKAAGRIRVAVLRRGRIVAETETGLRQGAARARLTVPDAELWWPNGMGAQPLYQVEVELRDGTGALRDRWERRIGLRTLALDRHKDAWGESFQFVANGLPFFAKGANWIPADAVLSRLTRADIERQIADSAAVHMNMIRVWGGGIYESDDFYDLCDEHGICVWQDFMFACATYPAYDKAFLANVEREAEDQVRRLRHHACLALWCGNNELEQINVGPHWTGRKMTWAEYRKLFDRLLPRVVRACDPQRDYWPSSPHSPCGDRADVQNPACGDAHLWAVWHGGKPFEWYRTCPHRFNSEFGFQSFPEARTVAAYTAPGDRNPTTRIMEHHQRSGIGNTTMVRTMLEWFRLPFRFPMLLRLSQIQQGMAMKYAVEHWRRSMPRGMGTLYWQLNDCWPVASWSSIDYFGRWKALHYMARRFFAPTLLSLLEDRERGTVELHASSDAVRTFTGRAVWRVLDVDGRVVAHGEARRRIEARTSRRLATLNMRSWRRTHGDERLILEAALLDDQDRILSENALFWARPKHLELRDPGLSLRVEDGADGGFRVRVKARRPALWVWLELEDGDARFSDNFLHVFPGRPARLDVRPARPLALEELRRRLRLYSLVDTADSGRA